MTITVEKPRVGKLPTLFDALSLIEPYSDHRTYGAAVRAIHRAWSAYGPLGCLAKAQQIADCYEEVYLREAVNGMSSLL